MPAERPKLLTLSSLYSAGMQRAPPSFCNTVVEARLCGWSKVARSRRGVLSLGYRNGDSPLRSFSPYRSLSLSCANAYLTLMIFQFSFPMLWSPTSWFPPTLPLTPICFPLSLFLSPSSSPWPVLPSSQSLFLLEFSSLCFLLLSFIVHLWGEFHKEKVALLWVLRHLLNLYLVERTG